MSTADTERFVRITLLTFEGGLWIARKILMREVDRSGALTLDALLLGKNTLLKSRRDITKRQFETMFPISGNDTNIADWDLSLLIRIIKILFGLVLSGQDLYSLDELLRIRNEIVCHTTQPYVSEQDFYSHWTQLTICIGSLASHFDVATTQYASDLTQRLSRGPLDLQSSIEQIAKLCRNDEHMENILETLAKQERKLNEVASGVALANQKIDDVLAVVRELKRNQNEREEDVSRVVIPLLNTTVCISGKKDEVVKLAQDILLKVHKTAIDKVENPDDEATVKDAVQQFLADIETKGAIVVSAENGSIILKIRCNDLDGLDNMLSLFRDSQCRCRLVGIENALSAVLLDAVKVELVLPDSTIEMMREWIENDAHVNKRYLNLGIQCDSVEAAVDVMKYLQGDESANRLNQIAEAMSRVVGDQVKVDAMPDVEGFSQGLIANASQTRVEETYKECAPLVPPARTTQRVVKARQGRVMSPAYENPTFSFEGQHTSLDCIQRELKILGRRINQQLDVTAATENLQKATIMPYSQQTDTTYESDAGIYVEKIQGNEHQMVVCEPTSAVKTILHHRVGKHTVTISLNIVSSLCQIINEEGKVMPLDSNGDVWLEITKRGKGIRELLPKYISVRSTDKIGEIRKSISSVKPLWPSEHDSITDIEEVYEDYDEVVYDSSYMNTKVDETECCIMMNIKVSSDSMPLTEFEHLENCEPLQIALRHPKVVSFLLEHAQHEGSCGLEMSVIGLEYKREELYTIVNREHEDQREEIYLNPEQCLARRPTLPPRTFELRHHQNRDELLREWSHPFVDYYVSRFMGFKSPLTVDYKKPSPPRRKLGEYTTRNMAKLIQSLPVSSHQVSPASPRRTSELRQTDQGLSAPWYHGNISRESAMKLMEGKKDGSFLVRDTLGKHKYTLGIVYLGRTCHFKIWLIDNKYTLGPRKQQRVKNFHSMEELIDHAMETGIELWGRKVVMTTPIERVGKASEGEKLTSMTPIEGEDHTTEDQHLTSSTPIEKKGKVTEGQQLTSITPIEGEDFMTEDQEVTSITPIEGDDHTTEGQQLASITLIAGMDHTTEDQRLTSITPVEGMDHTTEDQQLTSITPIEREDHTTEGQQLASITPIEGEDHKTEGQQLASITPIEGMDHTTEGRRLTSITPVEGMDHTTEGQHLTSITPIEGEDHATESQQLTSITPIEGEDHATASQQLTSITPIEGMDHTTEGQHLTSITPIEGEDHATESQQLTSITPIEVGDHTTEDQQ